MKEKFSTFVVSLLGLFLLSILVDEKKEPVEVYSPPKPKSKPASVPILNNIYNLDIPKYGKAQNLSDMSYVTAREDKRYIYGYSMATKDKTIFASVKPSTENDFFFVNSYLNGFVPYSVENIWVTLAYLQSRLKYQLDEKAYNNRKEVWQTSKQSYEKLRGDCEDHAILLADWLIGLGYDVRVVAGTVKTPGQAEEGHAWVVLYYDGKEYLLEATRKSKWSRLPLAKNYPNYHPKYMFNREEFWINTGSEFTTKYSGKKWVKSGKFVPYNKFYKDLKV